MVSFIELLSREFCLANISIKHYKTDCQPKCTHCLWKYGWKPTEHAKQNCLVGLNRKAENILKCLICSCFVCNESTADRNCFKDGTFTNFTFMIIIQWCFNQIIFNVVGYRYAFPIMSPHHVFTARHIPICTTYYAVHVLQTALLIFSHQIAHYRLTYVSILSSI